MITFNDLNFEEVPSFRGRPKMRAQIEFDNGYGASVITEVDEDEDMDDAYYELAVLQNGTITTDTPITNDVLSSLSKDEVTEYLKEIENLQHLIIFYINPNLIKVGVFCFITIF